MAAELQREFPGVSVQLIPASGGLFEVTVDGEPVFSKQALKRHAAPGEVVQLIRNRQQK